MRHTRAVMAVVVIGLLGATGLASKASGPVRSMSKSAVSSRTSAMKRRHSGRRGGCPIAVCDPRAIGPQRRIVYDAAHNIPRTSRLPPPRTGLEPRSFIAALLKRPTRFHTASGRLTLATGTRRRCWTEALPATSTPGERCSPTPRPGMPRWARISSVSVRRSDWRLYDARQRTVASAGMKRSRQSAREDWAKE